MELSDLISECRALISDDVEPYEFSNETLVLRFNEAQKEACTRSDLIIDSVTTKICNVDVVAGVNNYKISPLIIDVLRAKLPSYKKPLLKLGYKEIDEENPSWNETSRTPFAYALNLATNTIQFSSLPKINETLSLTVSRLPLEQLEGSSDEPEINEKYHYDLIYWVLHLCYLSQDADIFDPNSAAMYEQKFELRFGQRKTSKDIEDRLKKYRRRAKAQFF